MSMTADTIVDRRRIRRKLTFWRLFAAVIAVSAVLGYALSGRWGGEPGAGPFVARVTLSGLIRGDLERVRALDRLAASGARAVVLHVDSPGGTTAGSEQVYEAVRRISARKPVVVVVDSLAASGGYIVAMAGDHIVAQSNSIVGSIGVLAQYPNFTELLKTIGVKVEEVKSSPLKAAPNAYEPTSPEARAALEAIVMDAYGWFRGLVQNRRRLDGPSLDRVADGRVFTGRQGLDLKLVDEIGDEQTALAWLAREKGIDPKLPVRDWRLRARFTDLPFLHLLAARLSDAVGLSALSQRIVESGPVQAMERLNLDGLLTLWHPPGSK